LTSTWLPTNQPILNFLIRCKIPLSSVPVHEDTPLTKSKTKRTISLPLPSNRLASSALQALEVDAELSPFVRRSFALKTPIQNSTTDEDEAAKTVLETTYRATTNRMLRVAVNGFMESLGVVLGVMEELDVDVLSEETEEEK
jgi:EKC/KEOPS complex subunit PCC1/LAGE3